MHSAWRTGLRRWVLSPGVTTSLPWALFALTLAFVTAAGTLALLNRSTEGLPEPLGQEGAYLIPPLASSAVGLLLALRVPHNAVGWLFAIAGI